MWWINRFGSVSGPFTQEQVERLVRNNQLTRLHKVSKDKRTWQRVDQTEFWTPQPIAPDEMEFPSLPVKGATPVPDRQRPEPCETTPSPETVPKPVLPKRAKADRKIVFLGMAIGAFGLLLVAIVLCVVLGSRGSRKYRRLGADENVREEGVSQKMGAQGVSFDRVKNRVALIKTGDGSGTGFLVRMDGRKYLVSNEHVLRSKTDPEVTLVDGKQIRLGALSIAEDRDLARYEVDYDGECFELSDAIPNNGETIWTYGNSMGDGVITSLEGKVTGVGALWLKVSAAFVCGNSGSPIVTGDGKVVAVASFIVNGKLESDFVTKGTEFDEARRFGVRFTNVRWKPVDRAKYKLECARYEAFCTYWRFLHPYLICLDVDEERLKNLYLTHEDIDRKAFGGEDYGFHEMLMELAKSYAGQGRSWRRWMELVSRRDALITSLEKDVHDGARSLEDARAILDRFDQEREVEKRWSQVKGNHRDFNAKRKESLLMARAFLEDVVWQDPRMRKGDESGTRGSVDWFQEQIQFFLDANAQALKNLNKALNDLEKGDDDEE